MRGIMLLMAIAMAVIGQWWLVLLLLLGAAVAQWEEE